MPAILAATPPLRLWRRFRELGPRAAFERAAARVLRALWWQEEHVWYALPTAGVSGSLPAGYALARLRGERSLRELARRGIEVASAAVYVAAGGELWLLEGATGDLAFLCWIFRERAPALAAPGGWFRPPAGSAVLEDSFTAPAHRGRGLAPAVWRKICAALVDERIATLLTKVEVTNMASRRACEKAGFEEVGRMRYRRRGLRREVVIEGSDPRADALRQALIAESG